MGCCGQTRWELSSCTGLFCRGGRGKLTCRLCGTRTGRSHLTMPLKRRKSCSLLYCTSSPSRSTLLFFAVTSKTSFTSPSKNNRNDRPTVLVSRKAKREKSLIKQCPKVPSPIKIGGPAKKVIATCSLLSDPSRASPDSSEIGRPSQGKSTTTKDPPLK